MRNIEKLKGESKELYLTVAPIIMNNRIITANFGGYPVITSKDHVWYVLKNEGDICAFVSTLNAKNTFQINDLYISDECAKVQSFEEVMKVVMNDFKQSSCEKASAYCKSEDIRYWQRLGFEVTIERKNWSTLQKTKQ